MVEIPPSVQWVACINRAHGAPPKMLRGHFGVTFSLTPKNTLSPGLSIEAQGRAA
jgi:hypothetical protein